MRISITTGPDGSVVELGCDGPALRAARQQAGYPTLTAAARAIGVSKSWLSLLENEHENPSYQLAARIAEVYGVSPATFLRGPVVDVLNKAADQRSRRVRSGSRPDVEGAPERHDPEVA